VNNDAGRPDPTETGPGRVNGPGRPGPNKSNKPNNWYGTWYGVKPGQDADTADGHDARNGRHRGGGAGSSSQVAIWSYEDDQTGQWLRDRGARRNGGPVPDPHFTDSTPPTPSATRPPARRDDLRPAAPLSPTGYLPPGKQPVSAVPPRGAVSRPRERVRGMNAALESGVAGVGEMAPARQPARPRQMIMAVLVAAAGLVAAVLTYKSVASGPVSFSGEVVPQHVYSLSFGTTGTITAVKVQVGQRVTSGEVLATQNASLAQANLQEAKDSEAAAAAALHTDEHPLQSGITEGQDSSQSSLDQAKQRLAAAEAVVAQDEIVVKGTSIISPASGTIGEVSAATGDSITGTNLHNPVVTVDSGPLIVSAHLPGTQIGEVRAGQELTFDVQQLQATLPGKVLQVNQVASQSQSAVSYVVLCQIETPDSALIAGMTVSITPR
jgi:multidrug resistance efflux pump